MKHSAPSKSLSIDLSGLTDDAIRVVESLVASLRAQEQERPVLRAYEEWSKEFHEWIGGHRTLDTVADDSREGIYGGRGK